MGRGLLVGAVATAMAVAGCTTSADRPRRGAPSTGAVAVAGAGQPADVAALTGPSWRLLEYARPGNRAVRVGWRVGLSFGEPAPDPATGERQVRVVASGCNTMDATAVVSPGHFTTDGEYRVTQVACGGAPGFADQVVFGVVASKRVEWRLDGARLRLRSDGGTLLFEEIGRAYAGAAKTIASGEHSGWKYRLYAQPQSYGLKLALALRDAAGRPVRAGATGEPREDADRQPRWFAAKVADAVYVGGFAPRGTVRVVQRAAPGAKGVELAVYDDVPEARRPAFGGIVPSHPRGATVTAYGRGGVVLGVSHPR